MDRLEMLYGMLGAPLHQALRALPLDVRAGITDIRLRVCQAVQIQSRGVWHALSWKPDANDCERLFSMLCQQSPYAREEEIRAGYLALPGGCRVGLAGQVRMRGQEIASISPVVGFAIRIGREVRGCADAVMNAIVQDGRVRSTLLISPPGAGKTTLLRDIARQLSMRYNVVILDERSEIAGCLHGIPQLDVGGRTDVLDQCSKAQGMHLALRSLAPDVLITDEIGSVADVGALEDALRAGVALICTAHARDMQEARKRPLLAACMGAGAFECFVTLGFSQGVGSIERIETEMATTGVRRLAL